MAKRSIWPIIALATISALFLALTLDLLIGRFNRGNDFAPYSTFRSDPLGLKIFHDALKKQPGVTVEKFMNRIDNLPDGKDKTLFICGADKSPDPPKTIQKIEAFAKAGGRVVITFIPIQPKKQIYAQDSVEDEKEQEEREHKKEIRRKLKLKELKNKRDKAIKEDGDSPTANEDDSKKEGAAPQEKSNDVKSNVPDKDEPTKQSEEQDAFPSDQEKHEPHLDPESPPFFEQNVSIETPWNFKYATYIEQTTETEDKPSIFSPKAEKVQETPDSPQSVSTSAPAFLTWRSSLYFASPDPAWRAVYQWRPEPNASPCIVVMERSFGDGSIVLCSDSFLLSNEAMQKDRQADFLSWLTGASTTIIFEESHLGNLLQANTMTLAWKYRLHGVVASLILLALLYIWKSVSSLTPKRDFIEEDQRIAKDHAAALTNLLRRSVPRKRLLEICVQEWRKGGTTCFRENRANEADKEILERIQGVVEAQRGQSSKDITAGYAAIREIISERAHNRER